MSTSTLPLRKRSFEIESPIQPKKIRYWFRLESESSSATNTDDTESVYSVQDKETDVARDTTDTESNSSEYDIDIEYEIESLSGNDDRGDMLIFGSSDESEDIIFAAAVVGDSSLETFITDAEDSDNSRQDDSSGGLRDYWICIQCKSQNDNPQYRFCDKCFQDRKAMFPPRPRRRKKAEKTKEKTRSPKLDGLKSCLSGLSSQDSGIGSGSSQEYALGEIQIVDLEWKKEVVIVPEEKQGKNRKRQHSESSLDDEYEAKSTKKVKKEKTIAKVEEEKGKEESAVDSEGAYPVRTTKNEGIKGPESEYSKEDCIICNSKPKNSVFLHGRIAHMCCCYTCAMRTWKSLKRCPICQRKVSNVVRVFTT